jgi:hypothetical protein
MVADMLKNLKQRSRTVELHPDGWQRSERPAGIVAKARRSIGYEKENEEEKQECENELTR